MGQEPVFELPAGLLELKAALEAEWPARRAALHATGVPLGEGDETETETETETGTETETKPDPDEGLDAEQLKAELKKARAEAAKRRVEAREAKARAKEYEDQNKTEAQRLEERATTAEQRASTAEATSLRLEVALDKAPEEMAIAQVRKLARRITGSTKEEMEADAEELFADFAPSSTDDDPRRDPSRRPRERLRPGAAPSAEEEETDPAKLAAKVPRRF
jgi:hypothetical protein